MSATLSGGGEIALVARQSVFGAFILFCRIGGCLMLAPGVSNAQIPAQVRLLVAVAVTLALAPFLLAAFALDFERLDPPAVAKLIMSEALIGVAIGLMGRLFFSALETVATASAQFLGLANPFGVQLDHDDSTAPVASVVTIAAVAILFAGDFHWEILRGLVSSYRAIPLASGFEAGFTTRQLVDTLGQSFFVAARVASPFFIYSLLINFTFALVNRVTPQISIFFVAPPFIAAGGVLLFYVVGRNEIGQFMAAFSDWLSRS